MSEFSDDDPMRFSDDEAEWEARQPQRKAANGSDGEPPPALRPINPATLEGLPIPQRPWLVPDWVPMSRVTGLYGAGGEGKTLLAQMLATACALGKPWLGLPVRQCPSLLFFCEDDTDEMHRRQEDINAHYGCAFADLAAMRWLPRLGDDNELMMFINGRRQSTPLLDQLVTAAKEHSAQLIVTDTLADVFGGNENDRAQARAFAQSALGYIARQTEAALLALAHPSLSGQNEGTGRSGSTAWPGTFRSGLYLASQKPGEGTPPDPDLRELTRTKANYARKGDIIELRWQNGVFLSTAPPSGILGSIERRTCERVFIDLLERLSATGQYVSHNQRAGNYAPRIFALQPDRERFGKPDFERAMHNLLARGEIVIAPYRDNSRHWHERLEKDTRMTERHPTDDEDICAAFALRHDSEGYSESEFRAAMTSLLAKGIIRRVPYITADGDIRFRIEPVNTAFGAVRSLVSD